MIHRTLKLVGGTVGAASLGALGAYNFGDEGTKRSMTFWGNIFPAYLHYRTYQLLDRDLGIISSEYADEQYEKLHEKYSDKVKHIVYSMRGFYLKNAQTMSTQDDFVPPAYMKWVKDTQDNVPSEFSGTEAREYVRLMMKEELALDFDDVFSCWCDVPLGVASIGQVHKATLKSSGEVVAVKLLVPGIEDRFRSDIRTLKGFCKLAMPQHVTAFDEIEKQFLTGAKFITSCFIDLVMTASALCNLHTEFDYVAEAKNLELIHQAIMPKWGSLVKVPQAHPALCSKHLLVMEYLDGVKLVDGIRAQYAKIAQATGTTVERMEAERVEAIRAGNFAYQTLEQSRKEREWLRWYCAINDYLLNPANLWKLCYNYSALRLLYGPYELERTEPAVHLGATLELLCKVHGNEIFEHGTLLNKPAYLSIPQFFCLLALFLSIFQKGRSTAIPTLAIFCS